MPPDVSSTRGPAKEFALFRHGAVRAGLRYGDAE